jgi:hypothetical protein
MAILATIDSDKEITFIKEYDDKFPTIAEVFMDKYLFSERIEHIKKLRNREIIRMCEGEKYNIIIHRLRFAHPFPEFVSKVSEFLTLKEKARLGEVSTEFSSIEGLEELRKRTLFLSGLPWDVEVPNILEVIRKTFSDYGVVEVGPLKKDGDFYIILKDENSVDRVINWKKYIHEHTDDIQNFRKKSFNLHSKATYFPPGETYPGIDKRGSVAIYIPPKNRKGAKMLQKLQKDRKKQN